MSDMQNIDHIYTLLKHGCYQRSLHFHNTPLKNIELYKRQLDYVKLHYETVSPKDILRYLKTGERPERPSILIGGFDGYRNNYDVLWRLLEERQMHGWFLLVTDFLEAKEDAQEGLLSAYRMQWLPNEYADGRYAMNWTEAEEISRKHTIVNHSSTHFYLSEETEVSELEYEIIHAEKLIMEKLGRKPDVFSWLGGAWMEKNKKAAQILREQKYHFLLGYRLEYFDGTDGEKKSWEKAVSDHTIDEDLDGEVRKFEQFIGNVGWYSSVPAILPLYQEGYFVTKGNVDEDIALAEHYSAIANYLIRNRGVSADEAAQKALDVLAVNQMGEDFYIK